MANMSGLRDRPIQDGQLSALSLSAFKVASASGAAVPSNGIGASKRWPLILVVAMLVTIGGWFAGLPKLWSPAPNPPKPVPESPSSSRLNDSPHQVLPVVPLPPQGNDSSISKTPLPLFLTGTLLGRNAHEGQAFIGVDRESPQTYRAGAVLVNDARIADIYADHVVLERNGQRVSLHLDGRGGQQVAAQLSTMLTVGGIPPKSEPKPISHELLTDYIRPNPVYDGLTLRGYQVYAGQSSGVFYQMGLQPGDVVASINGVPLNEPQASIDQLRQIVDGIAVTATIERQGRLETLSLDGALIQQEEQRKQMPQTEMPGTQMMY